MDLKDGFAKGTFDIPCPGCHTKIRVTGYQIMRSNIVKCPGCGADVKLDGSKVTKELDRVAQDIENTIKRAFKGFK